jgi:polyglutamine-binding protein 1
MGCVEGTRRGVGLAGAQPKAADTTASGPLFQSRPYASPGAVLKANAEAAAAGAAAGGGGVAAAGPSRRPPPAGDGRDGLGEAD